MLLVAQRLQILPEIAPCAGIEAGGRFIEQQHSGMVQQSFSQLDTPLHSAGKSFNEFLGAIREANAREDFMNALLQRGPAQSVKMSLMPKILVGGELQINALRLKDHADLPPQARRFLRRIVAHDRSAARAWKHQGGENPEERGLAAAVGTEQAEQLSLAHIK